jgi:hypothetical protein
MVMRFGYIILYHFNFVVWRDIGNVVPPGGHLGVAGVTERCVLEFLIRRGQNPGNMVSKYFQKCTNLGNGSCQNFSVKSDN